MEVLFAPDTNSLRVSKYPAAIETIEITPKLLCFLSTTCNIYD